MVMAIAAAASQETGTYGAASPVAGSIGAAGAATAVVTVGGVVGSAMIRAHPDATGRDTASVLFDAPLVLRERSAEGSHSWERGRPARLRARGPRSQGASFIGRLPARPRF